ncbi:hypothetical protein [Parafilimonas sp.]|uniref:hypothetical protein n=1 Tax=Parafilimonas sp. TaxID=1969739 RepID=UPI0039E369F9
MGFVIFIIVVIIIAIANSGSSSKKPVETQQQRQERLLREQQRAAERQRQIERERQATLQRQQEEQQRQLSLTRQRQALKVHRLSLQETGTDYCTTIASIMQPVPNFWKMYEHNIQLSSHLTASQILNTNNGIAIIQDSQTLINYITAYGGMHYHKLQSAFNYLFPQLPNLPIDIVDYGCGQALASIAFYDYAIRNNKNINVDKIILIEPSEIALKRGILKLNYFIDYKNHHVELSKVNKRLDNITNADLTSNDSNIKVHLLSNILDVDSFNYIQLANKIKATQKGTNYFVCVSPDNNNALNRINSFQSCFIHTSIPCQTGTIYGKAFRVVGKSWLENYNITMVLKIFRCNL